jgi:hypothetical protein
MTTKISSNSDDTLLSPSKFNEKNDCLKQIQVANTFYYTNIYWQEPINIYMFD